MYYDTYYKNIFKILKIHTSLYHCLDVLRKSLHLFVCHHLLIKRTSPSVR